MKHLILPLLLIFGLFTVTAQNILSVNINDACQKRTTANTTVSLYSLSSGQETLVKESQSNPAIFEQLEKDKKYKVKIQVADAKAYDFNIKDMVLIHYHILGLQQLQNLALFASDANNDGRITASDITTLSKVKLNIDTTLSKNFIIGNSSVIGNITALSPEEFLINEVSASQSVNVQVAQKGSVFKAQTAYCNGNCPDITDKTARLIFKDMPIQKGKDIEVPIFVLNEFNYQAFDFKLFLKDALLVNSKNSSGTSSVIDNNEIHILHQRVFNSSPDLTIVTLKIHPKKDGNLQDIIFINQNQHDNLATVKVGSCILNIENVILTQDTISDQNCIVSWPKDIEISSCDALSGLPSVDNICQNIVTFSYQDSIVSPCKIIYRKWKALNWLKATLEIYTQKITVDTSLAHTCTNNFSVNIKDGDQTISARSLVVNPYDDHFYSFSQNIISDSIRTVKNENPSVMYFEVYDHTSSEFCIAKIEKTLFNPVVLNVVSLVSIPYTGGDYEINAFRFSSQGTLLPPGISDLRISFDGGAFMPAIRLSENWGGQTISLSLKYRINGVEYIHGTVQAYLSPKSNIDNIGPLKFFAYNDFLSAGKEYDINIQSSNFYNITSFQAGFRLKDADVVTVSNGVLEIASSNFYIQSEKALRLLWFEQSAKAINISSDKTIFKIRIKTERSGFLSEFIGLDNTVLASEANYEDVNIAEKILLEFNFPTRSTGIDITEGFTESFKIYPNPSHGENLKVAWSANFKPELIRIHDMMGRTIYNNIVGLEVSNEMNINLIELTKSGIYQVVLQNQNTLVSKSLIIK
jgi:hypothetical protein